MFAGFPNVIVLSPSITSFTGDFIYQGSLLTNYVLDTLKELPPGEYWIHFAGHSLGGTTILASLSNGLVDRIAREIKTEEPMFHMGSIMSLASPLTNFELDSGWYLGWGWFSVSVKTIAFSYENQFQSLHTPESAALTQKFSNFFVGVVDTTILLPSFVQLIISLVIANYQLPSAKLSPRRLTEILHTQGIRAASVIFVQGSEQSFDNSIEGLDNAIYDDTDDGNDHDGLRVPAVPKSVNGAGGQFVDIDLDEEESIESKKDSDDTFPLSDALKLSPQIEKRDAQSVDSPTKSSSTQSRWHERKRAGKYAKASTQGESSPTPKLVKNVLLQELSDSVYIIQRLFENVLRDMRHDEVYNTMMDFIQSESATPGISDEQFSEWLIDYLVIWREGVVIDDEVVQSGKRGFACGSHFLFSPCTSGDEVDTSAFHDFHSSCCRGNPVVRRPVRLNRATQKLVMTRYEDQFINKKMHLYLLHYASQLLLERRQDPLSQILGESETPAMFGVDITKTLVTDGQIGVAAQLNVPSLVYFRATDAKFARTQTAYSSWHMYTTETDQGVRRSLLITPPNFRGNRHELYLSYAQPALQRLASSGVTYDPDRADFFSYHLVLGGFTFYFVRLSGAVYFFRWSTFTNKHQYGLEEGNNVRERDAALQKMLALTCARGGDVSPLVRSITLAQDRTLAILVAGTAGVFTPWKTSSRTF